MSVKKEDFVLVLRCQKCLYGDIWPKPVEDVIGECRIRKMYSDDKDYCLISENDGCSFGVPRP